MRFVSSDRLGGRLALLAVALSASCLGLGFYLDDHVGRYLYSDRDGAAKLFRLWVGGYGLADGDPASAHWQIEQGWAPWWIYDRLLIRLFRPFGMVTHWLDLRLWPNSAWLMHLHSLLWLALLVFATTRMYRAALGRSIGGLAALLFAFDHTHGFVVGYICNRHALLTALLSVLCLERHLRARGEGGTGRHQLQAYALYALALFSGESALAILCYLIGYALCVEQRSLVARGLNVGPYLALTIVWRFAYNRLGFGAYGSGMYIDPGRDPVTYLIALAERAPVLLLGQFFGPPAELYSIVPPVWAKCILLLAVVFSVALAVALWPLLRRDRMARFWTLGALGSIVPAASTYPHDRQLLFTSFGAMALLAQLWQLHGVELRGRSGGVLRFSRELGGLLLLAHVVLSPLALPITTCSVAVTHKLARAPESIDDQIAGRDAVFVDAPDYFAVKLIQLERRIDRRPLPRRWRALAFGPEHIAVHRLDPRTLEFTFREGALSTPFMELYRDRRIAMTPGESIELEGLSIRVEAVTPDGRPQRVRYTFDRALESPDFRFYQWLNGRYQQYLLPPVGSVQDLPPAQLDFGFE